MVAPRAGAWIETYYVDALHSKQRSRPARARGLKPCIIGNCSALFVAPRAGAWIETKAACSGPTRRSRAPRGRVD